MVLDMVSNKMLSVSYFRVVQLVCRQCYFAVENEARSTSMIINELSRGSVVIEGFSITHKFSTIKHIIREK